MRKVITYGTFDLLHEGHYRLLKRAKALGDYLIVGVTSEGYDRARGKLNVIDPLATRIENVRRTGFADEIIVEENEGQKFSDIKKYGIDIFTVGSDWTGLFDDLKDHCEVVYLERTKDISSTMLRADRRRIQRIGMIGTGRIASRFVREAKLVSGVDVHGAYNPHTESVKRFASAHGINAYTDIAGLYDAADIVYIASPHETHADYAESALRHGKHVLCEKPMALSEGRAKELFALAKENGRILIEGIKTAYCPGFHRLLGIAYSGKIGKIRNVEACFTKLERPNTRELTDMIYGGSFLELGSYVMLPIIKLFGCGYTDLKFDAIRAENGLDIFTRATLSFPQGLATATCGLGVKSEGRLLISGTRGYIVVDAPWWKTSSFEIHYEDASIVEKYAEPFLGNGLRYELADMLRQMDDGADENFKLTKRESVALAGTMERFMAEGGRGYGEDMVAPGMQPEMAREHADRV